MAVLKPSGVQIINEASVAASTATVVGDCTNSDLTKATSWCITVVATFNALATGGIEVTLRPTYDGTNFDTAAWADWTWTVDCSAGNTVRRTSEALSTIPKGCKVICENKDASYAVTNLAVYAVVQTAG